MSVSEKLNTIAENVDRVYMAGENYGNAIGYEIGYGMGLNDGFEEGYNDGYDDGTKAGYEDGYNKGEIAGETKGYENGHSDGITEGFASGKEQGISEGKQSEYDRFWDAFQQNGNRKSYFNAFCGVCWSAETFSPKYPIKIVETTTTQRYADGMFRYFMRDMKNKGYTPLKLTPEIVDFSGVVNVDNIFNNAWFDEVVVDFSNAQRAVSTFALGDGGHGIRKITIKLTEKATNLTNMFSSASVTEELIFTEDSVIATSLDLQKSKLLSRASFVSIANALSPSVTATLKVSKAAVDAAFPNTAEWDALFADKPNWTVTEV